MGVNRDKQVKKADCNKCTPNLLNMHVKACMNGTADGHLHQNRKRDRDLVAGK